MLAHDRQDMAWTLLAAGMCFFIEGDKLRLGLVAFFIYLFTMRVTSIRWKAVRAYLLSAYSLGEGPVPWMYSAEGK